MYLFGGRLVAQRRMVADLYRFQLANHTWERLADPELDPHAPPPRYFHSADVWNGHLVVFGGMGYASSSHAPDDLCVLSDVRLYSLADACWLPAPPPPLPSTSLLPDSDLDPALASESNMGLVPRARYAHLSAVSANHLYIIGGQDMTNAWLDDIHVYDLPSRAWVARVPHPRHCGTYRSVAVCAPERVVNPPRVFANIQDDAPGNQDELTELPFTADATPDCPNNIYLYSNHNVRPMLTSIAHITDLSGFFSVYGCQTRAANLISYSDNSRQSVLPQRCIRTSYWGLSSSWSALSYWCSAGYPPSHRWNLPRAYFSVVLPMGP